MSGEALQLASKLFKLDLAATASLSSEDTLITTAVMHLRRTSQALWSLSISRGTGLRKNDRNANQSHVLYKNKLK